jgi:hypothetical protein
LVSALGFTPYAIAFNKKDKAMMALLIELGAVEDWFLRSIAKPLPSLSLELMPMGAEEKQGGSHLLGQANRNVRPLIFYRLDHISTARLAQTCKQLRREIHLEQVRLRGAVSRDIARHFFHPVTILQFFNEVAQNAKSTSIVYDGERLPPKELKKFFPEVDAPSDPNVQEFISAAFGSEQVLRLLLSYILRLDPCDDFKQVCLGVMLVSNSEALRTKAAQICAKTAFEPANWRALRKEPGNHAGMKVHLMSLKLLAMSRDYRAKDKLKEFAGELEELYADRIKEVAEGQMSTDVVEPIWDCYLDNRVRAFQAYCGFLEKVPEDSWEFAKAAKIQIYIDSVLRFGITPWIGLHAYPIQNMPLRLLEHAWQYRYRNGNMNEVATLEQQMAERLQNGFPDIGYGQMDVFQTVTVTLKRGRCLGVEGQAEVYHRTRAFLERLITQFEKGELVSDWVVMNPSVAMYYASYITLMLQDKDGFALAAERMDHLLSLAQPRKSTHLGADVLTGDVVRARATLAILQGDFLLASRLLPDREMSMLEGYKWFNKESPIELLKSLSHVQRDYRDALLIVKNEIIRDSAFLMALKSQMDNPRFPPELVAKIGRILIASFATLFEQTLQEGHVGYRLVMSGIFDRRFVEMFFRADPRLGQRLLDYLVRE